MDKDKIKLFEGRSVLSSVLRLAVPSVLGQLILVIYNIADTFFIGLVGNDAMLASVAVCMPAFMVISAISNLFGVGASSVISRSLGKGNTARLSKEEVEGACFGYLHYAEAVKKYDPGKLRDGYNTVGGEEIYYISNPALGLWADRAKF